jgi:hypothetical protein
MTERNVEQAARTRLVRKVLPSQGMRLTESHSNPFALCTVLIARAGGLGCE